MAFRGRAWFFTYGDASAGLYLHVAATFLHGHLPYATAWDYRPPGLFALYALALAVAGPHLAWNALTTIALGSTALAVGLLARRCDPDAPAQIGWLAAASFVLLTPENDGIFGNAEVEISAFVAWSLWFSLHNARTFIALLAAGLLAGCALQCKLSALPLALLPAIVLVAAPGTLCVRIRNFSLFACGFATPVAIESAIYAFAGRLRLLIAANVDATFSRATALNLTYYRANARYVPDQLRILAPQIELAAFARTMDARTSLAAWGWVAAAVVSIVLEGEFFRYQFIVLAAPIALLGTLGLQRILSRYVASVRSRRAMWTAAFLLAFGLHDYYETTQGLTLAYHRLVARDSQWHSDETSQVIAALARIAPREQALLLVGQNPYIYDALGIAAPTRFTAPVVWLDPRLTRMGGASAERELPRLFALEPHVVVLSRLSDPTYDRARVQRLRDWIASHYRPTFAGSSFTIYRAKAR